MNQFITLESDLDIEPGHQWLVMPLTPATIGLARLLLDELDIEQYVVHSESDEIWLRVPHNDAVDQNIVKLINQLAHVRFSAPGLVQLELIATSEVAE